jgi:predicted SprT family Zn-dependent metalloprotease
MPTLTSTPPLETLSPRAARFRVLAEKLLAAHGLHDWSFHYNRSKINMGLCRYGPRTIELSVHFVEANGDALVLDTLLHEIAHALVGPGHGHDAIWKRKCLEVGARPERVSFDVTMPPGRWQARCPGCGEIHHKHRKPKRLYGWYCIACGPQAGKLLWQPRSR